MLTSTVQFSKILPRGTIFMLKTETDRISVTGNAVSKIVTFPEIRPLVSDEIWTVGSLDIGEHFHRRKLRSEVWKYDFTSDQFVTVFLSKTGKLIVLHVGQDEDVWMVDNDDGKPVTMLVIVNGVGFPKLRAGSISWQDEGLPSCRKIDRSEADRAKHCQNS
ncbi:hypothetical protein QVD17_07495 [Tagetes erecta]|uniref:Uncharacterized protein n=1 Tax=Tagetes erecta TaxID=13708 RepID=A0AAD8PCY0_TARER|nr:hypothetical protein QVD17_07491 [Tagetes erecta]KAK1441526.1 hypothetical protein QVD17_07495 [Tagetes erecta]